MAPADDGTVRDSELTASDMILCCVCGSPQWLRCDPGHAPDAQRWLDVVELNDDRGDKPLKAWCEKCDPLLTKKEA